MYSILPYTKQQARRVGVTVKPSVVKGKKIDVFKDGEKVASVGAIGYKDYPTYMKEDKEVAEEHRRRYHIRHRKDASKKGTPGYYASVLLW